MSDRLRLYELSSATFELSALKTAQIFAKVFKTAEILTRLFVQRGQTQKKKNLPHNWTVSICVNLSVTSEVRAAFKCVSTIYTLVFFTKQEVQPFMDK